jgi:drug/metabolite transporter (DMT)-like permease
MLAALSDYVGPGAGLATSVLWTLTSLFFTAAGKRIGPTAVNAARISLAVLLLAITHRLLNDAWMPQALPRQFLLLALSGVIGLALGDQALFTAFVDIGPRRAMLIMTTAPLFAALFGWVALGETLGASAGLGIALVIGGVAWVISERPRAGLQPLGQHVLRGVILAFVAAACQAAGLMFSKQGMGHGWAAPEQFIRPQTATLIRMFFAGIGVLPILWLHTRRRRKRAPNGRAHVRPGSRRAGYGFAAAGAVVGPFLGVWMSLVASDRAPLGVAQTLCSLPPLFLLPFAAVIHKEHITLRAILGAVMAVSGVALLFIRQSA